MDIRPGGRECQCFNDDVFSSLRASAQVPDDFLNEDWGLEQLAEGGGKGGSMLARVGESYIVKELSRGDHATLLQIAGSYAEHIKTGDSLLCPIYLHFKDLPSGRHFFAMKNSIGTGPFASLYDLKGCADDKCLERAGIPIKVVHKRYYLVPMWCGKVAWSEERCIYFNGKLEARALELRMNAVQRAHCLKQMERDTSWLTQHRLMDYSLLLAIKERPAAQSQVWGQALVREENGGDDKAMQLSIIDFLQRWNWAKRIAMCGKFVERNKSTIPPEPYAARFCNHFASRLHALPEGEGQAPPKEPLSARSAKKGARWPAVDKPRDADGFIINI